MKEQNRPALSDYLVAMVVLAIASFGLLISPDDAGFAAIVLTVAQCAPLVYRRLAPEPVLGIVIVATVAYFAIDAPFVTSAFLGLMVAVYATASYSTERNGRIGLATTATAVVALFAVHALMGRDVNVVDSIIYLALVAAAWVLGDRARTRRAFTRSLEERAVQAETTRALEAAAAAAAERTRIARELHDVVGHSVSTMVLHAGAAKQVLEHDPYAARASLDLIEDTGRAAVGELRTILHALRVDEDAGQEDLHPQRGLDAIEDLVERTRAAGIETEVNVEGTRRELSSSVDLSAYRIVQEALTNTIKHSHARRAEVVVRFDEDHLLLQITDDGRGPSPVGVPGFGLAGMRERAELLDGKIETRRRSGGGFEVVAVLPLGGPTAP